MSMANAKSIEAALSAVIDAHIELEEFARCASSLSSGCCQEDSPAWVFVVSQQARRATEAMTALEVILRSDVLPLVEARDASA